MNRRILALLIATVGIFSQMTATVNAQSNGSEEYVGPFAAKDPTQFRDIKWFPYNYYIKSGTQVAVEATFWKHENHEWKRATNTPVYLVVKNNTGIKIYEGPGRTDRNGYVYILGPVLVDRGLYHTRLEFRGSSRLQPQNTGYKGYQIN